MKRGIMMIAGMLLVGGTVLAETNWDFSGTNIEWRTKVYDTQDGFFADDSEADVLLNAKWHVHENLSLNFELDTDDSTFKGEHGDDDLSVTFIYENPEDEFEVALDLEIRTEDGTRVVVDEGSDDTYLKWRVAEGTTLGFYPYNIGSDLGDEFETDYTAQLPGVVYERENWYAGLGATARGGETVASAKAGFKYNNESIKYTIDYTGALGAIDEYNGAVKGGAFVDGKDGIAIEHAVNLQGHMELGDRLALMVEAGMTVASDDFSDYVKDKHKELDDMGYGIFAKLSYEVGKYYPYGSAKYISESFLFDDDQSLLVAAQDFGKDDPNIEGLHEGLMVFALGIDYPIRESITLNTEFEVKSASEKVYQDTDNNKEDTDMSIAFGIIGEI